MYYSHFGLSQPPFRITPDTEFFYSGSNRGPILEALIYAISQGEGIIKVTGEVGSGKTMLCSMLQSRLPANVETVYIVNPSVSPEEILYAIAHELQLNPPRDSGHLETMQLLHRYLLERHAQDKQVVMFVEESQSMPLATLEEIRLLSNLETAHSKLLQIVLFGQPELEDNLREPHIRQLRERITHSFRLSPLKNDEVRDYLDVRLRAADYRGPDLFSPAVINAIAKASQGLTRRINLLADKALLAAFSENTHTVTLKHVKAAIRDSEFSRYETRQPRLSLGPGLGLAVLGIGAALGIALYALFQAYGPSNAPLRGLADVTQPQSVAPEPVATPPAVPTAGAVAASSAGSIDAPNTPVPAAHPAPALPQPAAPVTAVAPKNRDNASSNADKQAEKRKVSPNLQKPAPAADMLDARLAATQAWLERGTQNTYSIQLMGASTQQQLKNYLNIIAKYVEINDVFVYRTIAKEKPSLTVLYGAFNDRRAALDALSKLPAPLKAYKPLLRTVQGIRAEIADNQPS